MICTYVSLDGTICGRSCRRVEGCYRHWNRPQHPKCEYAGCDRRHRSLRQGFCSKHSRAGFSQKAANRYPPNTSLEILQNQLLLGEPANVLHEAGLLWNDEDLELRQQLARVMRDLLINL